MAFTSLVATGRDGRNDEDFISRPTYTAGTPCTLVPPPYYPPSHLSAAEKPRRVRLIQENFVQEYRVSSAVHAPLSEKCTTEFSHLRYTAAACDADSFTPSNGFTLRAKKYNRKTELLIAVTSYNEDSNLYSRTLNGVMQNVRDICQRQDQDLRPHCDVERGLEKGLGWQNIVVALIVDGIEKMDRAVLDILSVIGAYKEGVMRKRLWGKETVAHIFESTVDSRVQLGLGDHEELIPVQIILLLKAKNQKKINSHRWLFNAIGRILEPEACVLIDAGTKPATNAIYHLWDAFKQDENMGGCCGELYPMTGEGLVGKKLLNPLVAMQNFEYKVSNMLDKPLESEFGYISVLPGAFSAYRYRAILGRPLERYFMGDHSLPERLDGSNRTKRLSVFEKNLFLAEDRILSFELVSKPSEKWHLSYVSSSKAETDVPETPTELLFQRRRWLNGALAAAVYSLLNFGRMYKSGHGLGGLALFQVQAAYNALCLFFFSWFSLANMWISFCGVFDLLLNQGIVIGSPELMRWMSTCMKWTYIIFLGIQFVLAFGGRPRGERIAYVVTLWVFTAFALYAMACSLWFTSKSLMDVVHIWEDTTGATFTILTLINPPVGSLVAGLFSTFGIHLISSLLFADPLHIITSWIQYICFAPSFINVLTVYAYCNLHDVSWGTKGCNTEAATSTVTAAQAIGEKTIVLEDVEACREKIMISNPLGKPSNIPVHDAEDIEFRNRFVFLWILSNGLLALAVQSPRWWLYLISVITGGVNGVSPSMASMQDMERRAADRRNMYFALLFAMNFGLTMIRFVGCIMYWMRQRVRRFRRHSTRWYLCFNMRPLN